MLLDEIEAAELEGNDDRLEGVLCGAVKQLKVTRAKPDSTLLKGDLVLVTEMVTV